MVDTVAGGETTPAPETTFGPDTVTQLFPAGPALQITWALPPEKPPEFIGTLPFRMPYEDTGWLAIVIRGRIGLR